MTKTIACPDCGCERLQEIAYRYTWQPVTGLTIDGDADEYGEFDYSDETFVVGWDCPECGWDADGDTGEVLTALKAAHAKALELLRRVAGGSPDANRVPSDGRATNT